MAWLWWILWLVGAYLIGAIPFALVLGLGRGVDVRRVGSGNVGASNLGRNLGKRWGLGCFVLDVAKGLVPVLVFGLVSGAASIGGRSWLGLSGDPSSAPQTHAAVGPTWLALQWLGVGGACIAGHMYSIWIGFRGGKGVATSLGALLGVFPYLTLPAVGGLFVWLIVIRLSGYVSLASVVAAAVMPIFALISSLCFGLNVGPTLVLVLTILVLGLMVVIRHRSNLSRLRTGTETKAQWAQPRPK